MKRRPLTTSQKLFLIERQGEICVCSFACKEPLVPGQIEYDHRIPLSMGGTNDLENMDALIKGHHRVKSDKETTERAKADRAGKKHRGEWLNATDREIAARLARTKQIGNRP